MKQQPDFLWGVQYYRAPTPEKKYWEQDLENIKRLGFTDVKYWVQWRWSHRNENEFYFDDLDELMDLAAKNNLRVTLNLIFDITPSWILQKYPDVHQIKADGTPVFPYVSCCRQIGGMPGPCYNHSIAKEARKLFLRTVVMRYCNHPAMFMWDVWNEPEQCHRYRTPEDQTLICYCSSCRKEFLTWLQRKYVSIDRLNDVWGRCYQNWDEVELPRTTDAIIDFIDYREFHLDIMTEEAKWRLQAIKELDPVHAAYLHVVPNTSSIFNAVTGVDDFQLAKHCDVFASTNFAKPIWSILTLSAAQHKIAYNVECHIGAGSIKTHQKQISLQDMVRDLVPQLGLGIRGFMFWQYHAEVLGQEAPAWGCTLPSGEIGSIGKAAAAFINHLAPYLTSIMNASPQPAQVAILKDRKAELFHYALHHNLKEYAQTMDTLVSYCYKNNKACRIVDQDCILTNNLDGIRLLIVPLCYACTPQLAKAITLFVENGGTLLCEAHLGGYDLEIGRHSEYLPGCNLHNLWGIREIRTTSPVHLKSAFLTENTSVQITDDVKKALEAYGVSGGRYFLLKTKNGDSLAGADCFAALQSHQGETVACYDDDALIMSVKYGQGHIYYCGTNIISGAAIYPQGFEQLMNEIAQTAGIETTSFPPGVHADFVGDLLFLRNTTNERQHVSVSGNFQSLFQNISLENGCCILEADSADILIPSSNNEKSNPQ